MIVNIENLNIVLNAPLTSEQQADAYRQQCRQELEELQAHTEKDDDTEN